MLKYAFIDVETTGFAKLRHGVLTLSTFITDINYNIIDQHHTSFRPDGSRAIVWSDGAEVVHKISWSQAQTFPPIAESFAHLEAFLEKQGPCKFIAHNMPFDRRMVRELFMKMNRITSEFDKHFPEQEDTITLLKAAKLISGKTKSLGDVCKELGIDHSHHDAKSDAFVLIEIHKRCMAALAATASEQHTNDLLDNEIIDTIVDDVHGDHI